MSPDSHARMEKVVGSVVLKILQSSTKFPLSQKWSRLVANLLVGGPGMTDCLAGKFATWW